MYSAIKPSMGRFVTYQDFLCVANAPREVADVAVSTNDFGGEFDTKPGGILEVALLYGAVDLHMIHSMYHPLSILSVALHVAVGLLSSLRGDFGVLVEAVLHNGQQSVFDGAANKAVIVN